MILPLEKQCVSLEFSQKLRDLGVRQDSYFIHAFSKCHMAGKQIGWYLCTADDRDTQDLFGWHKKIAAYTVAELGEMLPKDPYWISVKSFWVTDSVPPPQTESQPDKRWLSGILDENLLPGTLALKWRLDTTNYAPTEADARAKMLVYLIENNLVADEWKERWLVMSDYYRMTKHPVTGKWEKAHWADNLFGHYRYGVIFPSDQEASPDAKIQDIAFDPDDIKLEVK